MTYIQFYNEWHQFACFSTWQIKAIYPDFNRSNYLRWKHAKYISALRQGWYAFTDYLTEPDYARYFAGKIYAPSYISLHTALAFYGIIPEAVVEITSVTTQKTTKFHNVFADYSYQTIQPRLFWGYEPLKMRDGKAYMMATPEKALLDLFYLYPQYISVDDMLNLRLDEFFMHEEFNQNRMNEYVERANNKALKTRVQTFYKAYGL